MKSPTEGSECCVYYRWFSLQYPQYARLLTHTPNEGQRNPRTGAYLKRMGMQPGWPDYFLAVPSEPYHGMFIEMKRDGTQKRKLPEHQQSMLNLLSKSGFYVNICYNAREAIDITKQYLSNASELPVYNLN